MPSTEKANSSTDLLTVLPDTTAITAGSGPTAFRISSTSLVHVIEAISLVSASFLAFDDGVAVENRPDDTPPEPGHFRAPE
jgi:hypothetical protein